MLKDREQLLENLAVARLETVSREDLERIYVEYMIEMFDQFSAAELVKLADSYDVDYQLTDDDLPEEL